MVRCSREVTILRLLAGGQPSVLFVSICALMNFETCAFALFVCLFGSNACLVLYCIVFCISYYCILYCFVCLVCGAVSDPPRCIRPGLALARSLLICPLFLFVCGAVSGPPKCVRPGLAFARSLLLFCKFCLVFMNTVLDCSFYLVSDFLGFNLFCMCGCKCICLN